MLDVNGRTEVTGFLQIKTSITKVQTRFIQINKTELKDEMHYTCIRYYVTQRKWHKLIIIQNIEYSVGSTLQKELEKNIGLYYNNK